MFSSRISLVSAQLIRRGGARSTQLYKPQFARSIIRRAYTPDSPSDVSHKHSQSLQDKGHNKEGEHAKKVNSTKHTTDAKHSPQVNFSKEKPVDVAVSLNHAFDRSVNIKASPFESKKGNILEEIGKELANSEIMEGGPLAVDSNYIEIRYPNGEKRTISVLTDDGRWGNAFRDTHSGYWFVMSAPLAKALAELGGEAHAHFKGGAQKK